MFANFGYQQMVCHDCKEFFDFLPRNQPKLRSILNSESALAYIGRFQIAHNGHRIQFIHEDDEDQDMSLIATYTRVADFELDGHISEILRLVYPDNSSHLANVD